MDIRAKKLQNPRQRRDRVNCIEKGEFTKVEFTPDVICMKVSPWRAWPRGKEISTTNNFWLHNSSWTWPAQDIHTNMRNMQNTWKTWQSAFYRKGEFTRVEFTPHLLEVSPWRTWPCGEENSTTNDVWLHNSSWTWRLRTFTQIWGTCRTHERRDKYWAFTKGKLKTFQLGGNIVCTTSGPDRLQTLSGNFWQTTSGCPVVCGAGEWLKTWHKEHTSAQERARQGVTVLFRKGEMKGLAWRTSREHDQFILISINVWTSKKALKMWQ